MTENVLADLETGADCDVADTAIVGKSGGDGSTTKLGDGATVRAGSIIYAGVEIGDGFATGHNAIVRSDTTIGDDVLVGTNTVIDGRVEIGSNVSLQTAAYLPPETTVGDEVFFGPHAVVTNDRYPVRSESELEGATIESGVSLGANSTVLPGVTVGENSFVAAGALVVDDVPPDTLVMGVPGRHEPLPDEMRGGNELA